MSSCHQRNVNVLLKRKSLYDGVISNFHYCELIFTKLYYRHNFKNVYLLFKQECTLLLITRCY